MLIAKHKCILHHLLKRHLQVLTIAYHLRHIFDVEINPKNFDSYFFFNWPSMLPTTLEALPVKNNNHLKSLDLYAEGNLDLKKN